MMNILLVSANRTLSDEIRHVLEEKLDDQGNTPLIIAADNMTDAKRYLDTQSFDLLISDLYVPLNWSSPIENDENGFELVRWARKSAKNVNTPAELLIPRLGDKDSERIDDDARNIPDCHVVPMGEKFIGGIVNLSKECLQDSNGDSHKGYLEVTIDLASHRWKVTGKAGMSCIHTGVLAIDENALSEIGKLSRQIEEERDRWQGTLKEIGCKLKELLLQPDSGDRTVIYTELLSCIREELARGNGGSLEDTRVRFILDPKFHSLLLESVMFPDDPKFWMLQAPFSRQLGPAHVVNKPPLFDRDQRFNCLIIDARLDQTLLKKEDSPTGKSIILPPLSQSSRECKALEKLFRSHSDTINKVELIRRKHKDEKFSKTVRDFLEDEGPWHLVHFGGHSFVDPGTREGYIFLQDVSKITSIEIAMFAGWLRQTSFIFLSSCQSSAKDFVLQLIRNQVPAVAGFRWDVEDDIAVQYADVFYNELFAEKSLDRAFYKARRTLYEDHNYRRNRIWAAPVLVDQHDL